MKLALACAASIFLLAPAVFSQSGQEGLPRKAAPAATAPDPFNGSWKINRAKSKQTTGEPPLVENITIRIENGIEHYTVEVQNVGAAASTKNSCDAKYNDGKWYPYVNRTTGETTSEVMMVKTDPRTEYRFMRNKDGRSTGVLMRRMAEDAKSYTSTMMNLNGEMTLSRVFDKQ